MLASATDALVALRRISTFLRAEELAVPYSVDAGAGAAVAVDGDFTWETVRKDDGAPPKHGARGGRASPAAKEKVKEAEKEKRRSRGKKGDILPTSTPPGEREKGKEAEDEKPFALNGVKLSVPKGAFVAIVGRVGSGKVCAFGVGQTGVVAHRCMRFVEFTTPGAYR